MFSETKKEGAVCVCKFRKIIENRCYNGGRYMSILHQQFLIVSINQIFLM